MSGKKNPKRSPEVDTALHVIKGAIVKVFNTPLTVSVEFRSKTHGRIVVSYEGPDPTNEQVKKVEDLANEIIEKDLPIQSFELSREEAEQRFESKVNNTFIYDKFPVPPEITTLSVVMIEDWNVNCCQGPHCNSTKEVGKIIVARANNRPKKSECEFVFDIQPSSAVINVASNAPAAKKKAAKVKAGRMQAVKAQQAEALDNFKFGREEELRAMDVNSVSSQIMQLILNEIEDESARTKLSQKLAVPIHQKLTILKNLSYSQGLDTGRKLGNNN